MRSDPCPYGLCDGSGFIVDEEANTASDCRCRPLRIAQQRTASLEARIPSRYRAVSLAQVEGDSKFAPFPDQIRVIRHFIAHIDEELDAGRGVWIEGSVGTGKTTLAMLISRAALDANRTVAIYSLPRLLNLIRQAIERPDGMLGFLDRLCSVDLLHIDDLGAETKTEWVTEQLYSIINTRYQDQRSIVITTNLKPEEVKEQLGERTASRIAEMCGDPLPLYGDDRRIATPEVAAEGACQRI